MENRYGTKDAMCWTDSISFDDGLDPMASHVGMMKRILAYELRRKDNLIAQYESALETISDRGVMSKLGVDESSCVAEFAAEVLFKAKEIK